MKITNYRLGCIEIDGTPYTDDLVIHPGRVEEKWWRRHRHRLVAEDLTSALKSNPDVLIIGTGYNGRMEVPEETREFLTERNLETHIMASSQAVALAKTLTSRRPSKRIVALLHLSH